MINRELIRIKTVQLAYANVINPDKDLEDVVKDMDESLSTAYDLYHHMLNLICDITDYAAQKYELTCSHLLERGAKNLPSDKFVANKFAAQLQSNTQLDAFTLSHKQLRWTSNEDVVHNIYNQIIGSPEYEDYMQSSDNSYESDRNIWRQIYKKFICQNELIDDALEEWSIFWNDDRFIIDTFVIKTIKRFEEANGAEQPLLADYTNSDDRRFGRDLLMATLTHRNEYEDMIKRHIRNWDFSRLVTMDVVIMMTALAEIIRFPGISINISLNEYINIAKAYSAPKSINFINATLDSIVRDLREDGTILK